MAVTAKASGQLLLKTFTGEPVNWTSDTIKVALLTQAGLAAWNQDTHIYVQDLINAQAAWEMSGTNYSAGGATLGTKTTNYDSANNYTQLRAASTVWSTATITAAYGALVYKSTGNYSTALILGVVDFGGAVSSSQGDFTIAWDSTAGVLRLQGLPTS